MTKKQFDNELKRICTSGMFGRKSTIQDTSKMAHILDSLLRISLALGSFATRDSQKGLEICIQQMGMIHEEITGKKTRIQIFAEGIDNE